MTKRKKHPNKEIEAALIYAEIKGWRIEKASGHAWGILYCPENSPKCRNRLFCQKSIWSTPKNASRHAKELMRVVDGCIKLNEIGSSDE